MKLFTAVLEKNTPTKEEMKCIHQQINAFIAELSSDLKKKRIVAEVMLGGSAAKDTLLNKDIDCDVFVRFDYGKYKGKDISGMLWTILKKKKFWIVHGSRDYYQKKVGEITFEVIPVLKISDARKAVNVTDVSPLHVTFIAKHFRKKPQLKNEIRLAKLFCKAADCYGAESYIGGFSGHVLDILISYYGSFLSLLKHSSEWKEKEVIDISKHKDVMLNPSKTYGPLIVIDPIQPGRNAAAALTKEKWLLFKEKAKLFLKLPSEKFFISTPVTFDSLSKRKHRLLLFSVTPEKSKIDIMGAKIVKAKETIVRVLEQNDFTVYDEGFVWNKGKEAVVWIIADEKLLSKTKTIQGPFVEDKKNARRFIKKHKKVYCKKNRYYADMNRKWRDVGHIVGVIVKDDHLLGQVKHVKIISKF